MQPRRPERSVAAQGDLQPAVTTPAKGQVPGGECCDTDRADCNACSEGVSVQQYCREPGHCDVLGCEAFAADPGTATPEQPGTVSGAVWVTRKPERQGSNSGAVPGTTTPEQPGGTTSGASPGTTEPRGSACEFATEPVTPYFWDETCREAPGHGCFADGINTSCRFCGEGAYEDIPCPTCTFAVANSGLHFWDNSCRKEPSKLGCRADGIHPECRYCGSGDFKSVFCPQWVKPAPGECQFSSKPATPWYWEPKCKVGLVGCLADGIHASCRWCGVEPYT